MDFGNFTNLTWANGGVPALNQTNLQSAWDLLDDLDQESRRSQTLNFKDQLMLYYETNYKNIQNFTDESEFLSSGGTQSNDTNYIMGKNAVKMAETSATAGWQLLYTSASKDLTLFNDGSSSSTEDCIAFVFYISDIAKVQNVRFRLGNDSSNCYTIIYAAASLVTGWNVVFPQKKDFTASGGTEDWSSIVYLSYDWQSAASSSGAYVTFQYSGLYREDAVSDGYFNFSNEYKGSVTGWVNKYTINNDSYLLYFDEGIRTSKVGIMFVDAQDDEDAITIYEDVSSFIAKVEMHCKKAGYTCSITWKVDANNYAECYISSNTLYLYVYEGGAGTTNSIALSKNLLFDEKLYIEMVKNNDTITCNLYRIGEHLKTLTHETSISGSSIGDICFGAVGTSSYSLITDFIISHTQGHNMNNNPFLFIPKSEDQTCISDDSLNNDNDFYAYLSVPGVYKIEIYLSSFCGDSGADITTGFVLSDGIEAITNKYVLGPEVLTTNLSSTHAKMRAYDIYTASAIGVDSINVTPLWETLFIRVIGAGSIQYQWAQYVSKATNLEVLKESFMLITRLT